MQTTSARVTAISRNIDQLRALQDFKIENVVSTTTIEKNYFDGYRLLAPIVALNNENPYKDLKKTIKHKIGLLAKAEAKENQTLLTENKKLRYIDGETRGLNTEVERTTARVKRIDEKKSTLDLSGLGTQSAAAVNLDFDPDAMIKTLADQYTDLSTHAKNYGKAADAKMAALFNKDTLRAATLSKTVDLTDLQTHLISGLNTRESIKETETKIVALAGVKLTASAPVTNTAAIKSAQDSFETTVRDLKTLGKDDNATTIVNAKLVSLGTELTIASTKAEAAKTSMNEIQIFKAIYENLYEYISTCSEVIANCNLAYKLVEVFLLKLKQYTLNEPLLDTTLAYLSVIYLSYATLDSWYDPITPYAPLLTFLWIFEGDKKTLYTVQTLFDPWMTAYTQKFKTMFETYYKLSINFVTSYAQEICDSHNQPFIEASKKYFRAVLATTPHDIVKDPLTTGLNILESCQDTSIGGSSLLPSASTSYATAVSPAAPKKAGGLFSHKSKAQSTAQSTLQSTSAFAQGRGGSKRVSPKQEPEEATTPLIKKESKGKGKKGK